MFIELQAKQYVFQYQAKVGLPYSYYFLAKLHTVRIPHQNETENGKFILYTIILIGVNF